MPLALHEYKADHPGYRPLSPDKEYEETAEHSGDDTPSPLPRGGTWSAVHSRANSGESEDPLAWSEARYKREMGSESIAGLVENFDRTRIGDDATSCWSSWSWSKEFE